MPFCCPSNSEEEEMLEVDSYENLKFKILLLGAGESGKSTVVKQLKNLQKLPLGSDELDMYATTIHKNLLECAQCLIRARQKLEIELEGDENNERETKVRYHTFDETGNKERLPADILDAIASLWETTAIQEVFMRRNEFYLLDAAPYYFDNLLRFSEPNYVPNIEDTIMARVRTIGIVETVFEDEPLRFNVVDVAGQVGERRKWIHCFSAVKAVIYVCSLAGYDQVMMEDPTRNRMTDSLALFESIVTNPLFESTPFFLLLNKKDLFEEMIREKPLANCFPEYEGGADIAAALAFIQGKFQSKLSSTHQELPTQYIAARLKKDVKYGWEDIKSTIIANNKPKIEKSLKKLGLKPNASISKS